VFVPVEHTDVAPSPTEHAEHVLQVLWSSTSLYELPLVHDAHTVFEDKEQKEDAPSPIAQVEHILQLPWSVASLYVLPTEQ
jgi:hypothetical protein